MHLADLLYDNSFYSISNSTAILCSCQYLLYTTLYILYRRCRIDDFYGIIPSLIKLAGKEIVIESKDNIFCWHHSDERRLRHFLGQGMIDCPSSNYLTKHGLKQGDRLRISVKICNQAKGLILAKAKLDSAAPFRLAHPRHKNYLWGVKLINIEYQEKGQHCKQYPHPKPPPMNPSHWV